MQSYAVLAVQGECAQEELNGYLGGQARAVEQNSGWMVARSEEPAQLSAVETQARMASAHIPWPTVFVACAEEKALLLGACVMGFTVFRHAIGETELLGIKEQHVQSRILQDVLKTDVDGTRKFVRERDTARAIPALERLLGIKLGE